MAWDEPAYDLVIASAQPEGKVVEIARHLQFGWPLQIKQRSSTSALAVFRQYVYDGHGQLCKTIEPETGATVIGYDSGSNPIWQASGLVGGSYASTSNCSHAEAWSSGRRVDRVYDAHNRLATLTFPDGLGNQSWTYSAESLPATITAYNSKSNAQGDGSRVVTAYTYNNRRLPIGESITQPNWYTWTTGYAYDAIGNLSHQTYPTGLVIDYAPNALGQATKAGVYADGAQYYPNGALKKFTYGNGVVQTMEQNARQLPSRVRSTFVPVGGKSMALISDLGYIYDQNGNITHIADHGRGESYSRWMHYDALDRLTDVGSARFGGDHWHRFTYDALDNLTSWKLAGVKDYASYIYDANNRLTNILSGEGATVVGLSYDAQGNLENKNGQIYVFDYGNRLRDVINQESYRYDGLGRRVTTSKVNGGAELWQYSQAGQMVFSSDWEGPGYLNQKTHEHVYLAGSLVASIDHDWPSNALLAVKYQHTDPLGSPVAVTNHLGVVIERMDYEPWGSIIDKPSHNGIGYAGHVMDGRTGLTYMQQRYYDSSIGRFLSVDPVASNTITGTNFNRYWYADNNPYRFVDPDGRQALDHSAKYLDLYRRHRGNIDSMNREMADGTIAGVVITIGVATALVPDPTDVMIGGFLARFAPRMFGTGRALEKLSDVWKMTPFDRGNAIERHLARTDYKDWFNVGQLNNGKFPLVDFQKGNTLVSLKSVDTTGAGWMGRMKSHIDDLASSRATVNGQPTDMVLDLRVQPGGLEAARSLRNYGMQNGVKVVIKEFK